MENINGKPGNLMLTNKGFHDMISRGLSMQKVATFSFVKTVVHDLSFTSTIIGRQKKIRDYGFIESEAK